LRAIITVTILALSALLSACGGGEDDPQPDHPDETIGPVQCAASSPACVLSLEAH